MSILQKYHKTYIKILIKMKLKEQKNFNAFKKVENNVILEYNDFVHIKDNQ